ncbi:PAS domain-containing protein [Chloroflexia bacterium SDU3-3]|nr:PAS domain-containing protein [Chloroflexia bacterium SDU3-3]
MSAQLIHSSIPAQIFKALFEQSPIASSLFDREGLFVAMNAANAHIFQLDPQQVLGQFNMITDPQLAAGGSAERHRRVMAGEIVVVPAHSFDARAVGGAEECWVEAIYAPLRDAEGVVTHLMAFLRDVTQEVQQNKEIERARSEIQAQQSIIESLATPVIQVWDGILAMPLVGAINSQRAMYITETLLTAISENQADCAIIDITGIAVVDTQVGFYILQAAQAAKLLGCDVALVGIGAEIAQTLIHLGIDMQSITTLANLQAGIEWAFIRHGMRVVCDNA